MTHCPVCGVDPRDDNTKCHYFPEGADSKGCTLHVDGRYSGMSTNTDWRKEPGVLVCCYCGRPASKELEPKPWDWAYVVCPRKPCVDLLRTNAPFKFEPVAVVTHT